MGYSYDQEWPIEPRGPKLRLLWRWSPDFTTSNALQTWSEMAGITFYLLIQVTSILLINLYDPSHSAARQIPQVRLISNPDDHTSTDITVFTYPWTKHASTRLHPRRFTRSLPASMPCLRFLSSSLLQVASERPIPAAISASRSLCRDLPVLRYQP